MAEFPFPLTIEAESSRRQPKTIVCVGLLRDLGRKRKVYNATWVQEPVVAKVFAHPVKAKYHMKREWRRLNMLAERDLDVPKILFCGRAKGHGWAVVTEKITDAQTVREVWDRTKDYQNKVQLLCHVSRELAKQHNKGVLQKDLHLGNFLLKGQKLVALDPAQMRFLSGPVGKNKAVAQLALLTSFLTDEDADVVANICDHYASVRSCKFSRSDRALFDRELKRARTKAVKNALKKCMRTNKRHERFRYCRRWCGVAARDFFDDKVDLDRLLGGLDKLMESGQVLKRGNTCFVSRANLGGQKVVVKRYNHKGVIHSLRHTIKRSRARRCWLHAHRLLELDIATPRPLAYIEHKIGPLVWQSYLVTTYVAGQKLCDFLRDDCVSKDQQTMVIEQIRQVLERMSKYRITHGDLKHTNILIAEKGPVLTDLDAMVRHRCKWSYEIHRTKDAARVRAIDLA